MQTSDCITHRLFRRTVVKIFIQSYEFENHQECPHILIGIPRIGSVWRGRCTDHFPQRRNDGAIIEWVWEYALSKFFDTWDYFAYPSWNNTNTTNPSSNKKTKMQTVRHVQYLPWYALVMDLQYLCRICPYWLDTNTTNLSAKCSFLVTYILCLLCSGNNNNSSFSPNPKCL